MKQEILKYADQVLTQSHMEPSEIPNIALYMDQIISLMDRRLESHKRTADDKILTKTMVHNYSKAKIIKPIKGKTYPREQFLQLLMVYIMKNTLTMDELRQVMVKMYDEQQLGEEGFQRCYDRFLQFQKEHAGDLHDTMAHILPDDKSQVPYEDAFVSLLCVASMSDQLHRVAEKIVDTYFPLEQKKGRRERPASQPKAK